MQPLQEDIGARDQGINPDNLHNVHADGYPVAPNGLGPTEGNGSGIAPTALHIALVIDNLSLWEAIKKSAYVISPPYWDGKVALHVVMRNPRQTPEEMLYKIALADLGLADPQVLSLTPPEQVSLGWPTEREP